MARPQRAAFGSISKTGSGTWCLRWWGDAHDGRGRRRLSKTVRGTRREASDELARIQLETERGPVVTLATAWERWVRPAMVDRVSQGDMAPGSLEHYDIAWRTHVAPALADTPLTDVSAADIQDLYLSKTQSQAEMARLVIRHIFNEAALRDVCASDIAYRPYRMPSPGRPHDKGIWDLGDLRRIWLAVEGTYLEGWFLLAAFGGPRVGESVAVDPSEVELEEFHGVPVAVVPIWRQADRDGSVTKRLKTEQSRHASVVPGPMAVRLHEICRSKAAAGERWLLADPQGRPMGRNRLQDRFGRVVAKAGVERHPVRNLRNSWETFTNWTLHVDPAKIERMMGHVGKGVTARFYDRPEARMLAEELARAYAANPYAKGWVDEGTGRLGRGPAGDEDARDAVGKNRESKNDMHAF